MTTVSGPSADNVVTVPTETISGPPAHKLVTVSRAPQIGSAFSSAVGDAYPSLSERREGTEPAGSRLPLPRPLPSPDGLAAALGAAGGGGLLFFGLLAFAFLLVIPTAVRWLRPALALGLSPAYVALSDHPG